MSYGIGLDIGISSIGYAVVNLNEQDEPCGIHRMGVRVFERAEHPKDGASLALPRREARGARRRLRRHRHRIKRIHYELVKTGFVTEEQLAVLFEGKLEDIYALRTRALEELVSDAELSRILIHLAQRRGFKSNRKSDEQDKEAGRLLSAVNANTARMAENGYRTVGEMFFKDAEFADHKRNKGENYTATVLRSDIEEEARKILAAQTALGNKKITEAFLEEYIGILTSQRPFDVGPGEPSPYGGDQIFKMIGKCTLEPTELRASKASYSFEYFQLLQKVNHIRIFRDGVFVPLNDAQRRQVIELAHKTPDVSYEKIRKALLLDETETFNTVRYRQDGTDAEKKEKLGCLKAYHEMRKCLDKVSKGRILALDTEKRNAIAFALTAYKTDEKIIAALKEARIEQADIEQLLTMRGFSKFGHLSVKACDALIPFLEQGMTYNAACEAAGYEFRGHDRTKREQFLPADPKEAPELETITSPVARRAIAQTIKVVNAIIRDREGSPTFVKIELARELSKTKFERDKLDRSMRDNAALNERLVNELREQFGLTAPTGMDIVKYRLYQEQGGVCPYSLKQLDLNRLFEAGYVDVDHIVPYSRSFDDRRCNKVLVLSSENRQKGNRLPLQYLTGARRDAFVVYVNTQVRDIKKKRNLLKESFTEEESKEFIRRNLQDTQTLSRFLYNYIKDHLAFASFQTEKKNHVTAVNGAVTAYLRKRWGIQKVREDGDLHHALDALVIACTTQGMISRVRRYSDDRETEFFVGEDAGYRLDRETGALTERFPYPWPNFRKEMMARISDDPKGTLCAMQLADYRGAPIESVKPIFVSQMPRHKVTGSAHEDTVKSARLLAEGEVLSKRPLTELKLGRKEDGYYIEGYYDQDSDRLLYQALLERLIAYNGNAEKAFSEPFYKPKSDGTPGPPVKKVKLKKKTTLQVPVQQKQAVADNGSMVRVDIFYVEKEGYYAVPIYVSDTVKPELPNLAVVAHKPYSEWKEMKEEDFLFSLHPSDLIYVEHKKGIKLTVNNPESTRKKALEPKGAFLYYCGLDISAGSINCNDHDRSYSAKGIGIKRLLRLEKYRVDPLGNITRIRRERRQTFR